MPELARERLAYTKAHTQCIELDIEVGHASRDESRATPSPTCSATQAEPDAEQSSGHSALHVEASPLKAAA